MAQGLCALTICFEDPFWVGVYERWEEEGYQVSRTVFGAEPRDNEVYGWLLDHWEGLRFSPFLPEMTPQVSKINSKRLRRKIRKCLSGPPVGTKAQEAIKLQHEKAKEVQRQDHQAFRQRAEKEKFRLRQEKKQQRHKGH